jgi:hypothetical protein
MPCRMNNVGNLPLWCGVVSSGTISEIKKILKDFKRFRFTDLD